MSPDQARARLDTIRQLAEGGDYEAARGAEDDLRTDVLAAVSDGHPDARTLALIALRSMHIFAREGGCGPKCDTEENGQ